METSKQVQSKALDVVYFSYHRKMVVYRWLSIIEAVACAVLCVVGIVGSSKKEYQIQKLEDRIGYFTGQALSSASVDEQQVEYDVIHLNLPEVEPVEVAALEVTSGHEFNGLQFYFTADYEVADSDQFVKGTSGTTVVYGSDIDLSTVVPDLQNSEFVEVMGSDRCVISEGIMPDGRFVYSMIASQQAKPFHVVSVAADRKAAYSALYSVSGFDVTYNKKYAYTVGGKKLSKYLPVGNIQVLATDNSVPVLQQDSKSFCVDYSADIEGVMVYGLRAASSELNIAKVIDAQIATIKNDLIVRGILSPAASLEQTTNTYPTWMKSYSSFSRYVIGDLNTEKSLFCYTMFDPSDQTYVILYTVSDLEHSESERVLHAVSNEIVFR